MKSIVFDTETTGLVKNSLVKLEQQPHITEYCGFLLNGIEVVEELEFLCNPGVKLEAIITKITGLKDSDLKDKPPFENYIDQVNEFMQQADVVVAHNAMFDIHMLLNECKRANKTLRFGRVLCTVEQTMHLLSRRMKLSELYEHLFGETFPNAHRARNDVAALTRVYIELMNRGLVPCE